ncbi:enolase C-terminal domain-like protein [Streptomyces johnsoniae]|uniref:Enolase C-terminal domain-like protein n=1 Tax=Streptomyces johnsoniae TaxID=3075532 RepID=A0ABU2S925_9ACTN|nr:enolase C-terminal domain-like protein [Streptomyces sp. DSM 41886]MDT0445417.1 enolase C-terminal domain-like protein [Streptomyces sp. DSM 41886]
MVTLTLHEARIDMKRPFRHARKARQETASVLVAAEHGGETGWGEAAPREYVTGESVASVLAALRRRELPAGIAELAGAPLEEALAGLAALQLPGLLGERGRPAPAAAAALETALFDLVCRLHGVDGLRALRLAGYGDVLAAEPAPMPVATVLDLGGDPVARLAALPSPVRKAIPHVKLKAGHEVAPVADLVARLGALVPDATVSVDANGAWHAEDVLAQAPRLLAAGVSWLEEPLAPRSWADLARLRQSGLRVMLDESFSSARDLADCTAHQAADLINLRVSKCGGPLRLLALARAASAAGVGVQLGVQVGEVGPLWATGRLIGTALRGTVAVEAGRQDEWFPTHPPLTDPAYQVDRTASRAPALSGPGIGLRPTRALLDLCALTYAEGQR